MTRCDQCASMTINGVFCHETGCPNDKHEPVEHDKEDEVIGRLNAMVASAYRENDDDPIEPYFSWGGCDDCDTRLGGDRYDIVYRETLDGELLDATVCVECYVALCS